MPAVSYDNSDMTENNFWESILGFNRSCSVSLGQILFEFEKNRRVIAGNFSTVILVARAVRDGTINPLELSVHINRQLYMVAPNGDLCRVPSLNDDRDIRPLEKMERLIGTKKVEKSNTAFYTFGNTANFTLKIEDE